MFSVRKAEQMVQNMIDYTRGQNTTLTDFRVGGRVRTIFEAVANIGEEIYYRMWQGAKALIEDRIYKLFDFPKIPAAKASGTATFGRNSAATKDITIPAGTYITTPTQQSVLPVIYVTTVTVTLLNGTTSIDAPIQALQVGAYANVAASSLTVLQTAVTGIDTVTNAEAISNGLDDETDEARKTRFNQYITTVAQGTNPALQYAAEQTAGVAVATVVENPDLYSFAYTAASSTYADNSYEINNPYGLEFSVLPANPVTDDIAYFGNEQKFNFLYFRINGTVAGGSGVWEYWNGTAWATLTVTSDTTNGLKQAGLLYYAYPSDWRDSKINGVYSFWIRYRVTGTWSPSPVVDHAFASPPPGYVDIYVQDAYATASDALVSAVSTAVEKYRGSGITLNVRKPSIVLVAITCDIKINKAYDGPTVVQKVTDAITSYCSGLTLGSRLTISKLENEILNLDEGAGSLVDSCTITIPTDDVLVSPGEIIRADTNNLTVTVVN